jgi:hypothetical protein
MFHDLSLILVFIFGFLIGTFFATFVLCLLIGKQKERCLCPDCLIPDNKCFNQKKLSASKGLP